MSDFELPDEPTIYDFLVMSLTNKDLIATFNWDPFLVQAIGRIQKYTDNIPQVAFLHGNVAVGYCSDDKGNMDIDKINDLMECLGALKEYKDYDKISIQLTTEELEVLVGRIYDYTVKLAKDNDVELSDEELLQKNNSDTIINLEMYLKAQKRIFSAVA